MKIRKNSLPITFLLLASLGMQAQETAESESKLQPQSKTELALLSLGYTYEYPIVDQLTLSATVKCLFGFSIGNDNTDFQTAVSFGIEPRYYHSYNRRIRKGKNVKNNAANFFSFSASYLPESMMNVSYANKAFSSLEPVNIFSLSPKYNIRRNMGQSNFAYELGAGLNFETEKYKNNKNLKNTYFSLRVAVSYTF